MNDKRPEKKKFDKIEFFYKQPEKEDNNHSDNQVADEAISINQSLGSLMHTMDQHQSKVQHPKSKKHSSSCNFQSLENYFKNIETEK